MQILEYLRICAEKNTLAHAYMLVGPANAGKMGILEKFLRELLPADNLNHPDINIVAPTGNTTTIESIRLARLWLSQSPIAAGKKILVITDAGTMNKEAQNAFLKILEEPAENMYIFLLAGHKSQVLPTIFSRVVPLYFASPVGTGRDLSLQNADPLFNRLSQTQNLPERMRIWLADMPAKDDIENWLRNIAPLLRKRLLAEKSLKTAKTIRVLHEALAYPSGQNWQLVAEHIILSL